MQKSVGAEIKRLLIRGHVQKIDRIKDYVFIQTTLITVKKYKSVKIALDARALNRAIDRDNYQMTNLENLMDVIAEKLDDEKEEAWYATLDLTYAYGQIPLDFSTAKHCVFQIIGGESTGTYRFITGFYGLTVMPAEFRIVMDDLLAKLSETVDILTVTEGSNKQLLAKVREILQTLNEANLLLKATKCKLAKKEIELLGFKLSRSGVSPFDEKSKE